MPREVEAIITAKTTVAGQFRYAWRQVLANAVSGVSESPGSAAGTGDTSLNFALERNNYDVDVGTRVLLREYGYVGNAMAWSFEYRPPQILPVSAWKAPARATTTTAGTLSTSFKNGDTIDGVTLATGDRILIKNQSSASENGIYTVNSSGAPTRATDADTGAELLGATVTVTNGTVNADTVWLCTANATITVGSTSLPFVRIGPSVLGTGTDNHVARFDGTGVQVIQDSGVTIDDSGNIETAASITSTNAGNILSTNAGGSARIAGGGAPILAMTVASGAGAGNYALVAQATPAPIFFANSPSGVPFTAAQYAIYDGFGLYTGQSGTEGGLIFQGGIWVGGSFTGGDVDGGTW